MESVDKLRDYCDKLKRVDDNCVSAEYVAERCAIDVRGMADAIEREVAERFVELPVDADGVPIHVGDVMERVDGGPSQQAGCVCSAGFNDAPIWCARDFRHAKPRTVEDVLRDAGVSVAAVSDVAAEIRELLEVDE